jgi:biopolymer transport protein ExbD
MDFEEHSLDFMRSNRKIRALSVVSLIDIVFTIILFFMVAGHLEKYSIVPVELPKADSGQLIDEGPIEVVLGRHDEVLINDELTPEAEVLAELKRQLMVNPERVITIKADANLEANRLVAFLEQIHTAGGKNLSLVTQSGTIGVSS